MECGASNWLMATAKRDQILQEAEKLVSRGKLDAAVREYRRALEQSPNDPNILNRLGDLLVRLDRIAEAIDVYTKVGEHFANDGFFLKGIAIYKKINRLDPQRTDVYEKLADLYFKQGLVVEGRQQLLSLADWFLRSKEPEEAVRVYQRLAELEPANFQVRGKLVDLLMQLGATQRAMEEIDALGKALLSRGMLDEAVKLFHRALDLDPASCDFLIAALDGLVAGDRATQAAELGQRAIAMGHNEPALRRATARALAEANDLKAARSLLEGLLQEVGSQTDVVQLYGDVMLRVGESEEAKEHLLPAVDRLLAGGDAVRAGVLVKRLLRAVPSDIDVLERALKVFDRRDDADMVTSIEAALADAYFRAGRHDAARPLYRSLVASDPANRLFRDRLAQLGEPTAPPAPQEGETGAAGEEVEIIDLSLDEGLLPPLEVPVEVPPLEASSVAPGPSAAEPIEAVAPAAAAETAAEEPLTGTNAEELFTEAVVFAKYGLTEKAVAHLHRLLALDPTHQEGRALLASLGGGELVAVEGESEAAKELLDELPSHAPSEVELEIPPIEVLAEERVVEELAEPAPEPPREPEPLVEAVEVPPLTVAEEAPAPLATAAPAAPPARPPARGPVQKVKLEELEAIIGLQPAGTKPARKPPRPPAAELPAVEISFDSLLPSPRAPKTAPPVPPPPPAPPVAPQPPAEPVEFVEIGEVLAGPDEGQLREVDFFIQQGLLDEAARLLERLAAEYPNHGEIASRHALLKARGWEEKPVAKPAASAAELFSEEEQFFDLAAELEQELADEELVAEARGKQEGGEASIEELFREFQRGVAQQLGEEDYDTHFNLGIAYREMGLLDEAIAEFQLAAKSPDLSVEAGSLIAGCYAEKGLFEEAAGWYARTLKDPGLTPEAELGLRYELARVHELAGNRDQALAYYAEVLAVNPGFRDVVERVSRMQQAN